jgi:hypothetical protein
MKQQILRLDPDTYQRHRIHTHERSWAETNCYVDVWVELLHAWGFEPLAALPFTLAIDFEGDQWTFFKFPHAALGELYGLDVQELAVWRPLVEHVEEQVGRGRPVLVELDSIFLPDTAGTAYRREHVKSTVAVVEIDVPRRQLGYFHGQGFYHLSGEDFENVFRLSRVNPEMLPPYVEFVKRRPEGGLSGEALGQASFKLLRRQLELLPEANPLAQFKPRLAADLEWLSKASLEVFHQYSFATLRQFGASYELAATYLAWLDEQEPIGLEQSIAGFTALSTGAKTLQFQLARAMARNKPLDLAPLDDMAATWSSVVQELKSSLVCSRSGIV